MKKETICKLFGHTYSVKDNGWEIATKTYYTMSYIDGNISYNSDKPFPVQIKICERKCSRCGNKIQKQIEPIEFFKENNNYKLVRKK